MLATGRIGRPGMGDIARAAGCSRATVYRYFDNKQALLRAFVHREARDVTEQVARQLEHGANRRDVVVEAVVESARTGQPVELTY